MKLYFAPMEGITGYILRNTHAEYFPGTDRYYMPFIAMNRALVLNEKDRKDTLPENNTANAIPQVLTNRVKEFVWVARKLEDLGYREVNLNLGCPSGTVVSKNRGAGFLREPEYLDRFFTEVFDALQNSKLTISVKTRIGISDVAEAPKLMDLFNRYPISELIVHPRLQKEQYKGRPHWEVFEAMQAEAKMPLCYNGDICSVEDYQKLLERFPKLEAVMLGRGLLADPSLVRRIQGGEPATKEELKAFLKCLRDRYMEDMQNERNVLFKMKEQWVYLGRMFPNESAYVKKIMKSTTLSEYQIAENALWMVTKR